MMLLFELRAKVTSIYQKYDFWINLALRFVLLFLTYSRLAKILPYSKTLCKTPALIALALVSSFLPSSLMVVVAAMYVCFQIVAADSAILALTVFALFMICYCFFLRFTPRQGAAMIATPMLQSFGIPYAVPILLGLFSNLLAIVPMCCGVFAFYTIRFVRENIDALAQYSLKSEPQQIFITVLDQLLKNPAMYVTMLILALVIIVVYLVRRINMDYAFEISIAVGTGVMMLGYIIADLKYDMGIRVASMVFACLISGGVCLVLLFFVRVLQYSAAEHVEFEDDDYFYYVTAIPKVKAGAPKLKEKKVIRRRKTTDDDDDDEEYEEAALGLIDYSNKAAEGLNVGKAKAKAAPIEEEDEDDEFGDDIGELVIKPKKRLETRVGDAAEEAPAAAPKASVPAPAAKAPAPVAPAPAAPKAAPVAAASGLFEDEEDEDEAPKPVKKTASKTAGKTSGKSAGKTAGKTKKSTGTTGKTSSKKAAPAAPAAPAPAAAATAPASKPAFVDDDDDDEDEQVIYGYFPEGQKSEQNGKDSIEDEDYL
ncbi:MAG: hypothetical protein J5645_06225 [Lachnospiraceae bacterium]|nr:hypothetical protein [Lachnospiraceae bacterium]